MKVLHILYSGLGGHGNEFFSAIKADEEKLFEYEALFNGIENVREEYLAKCDSLGIEWKYVKKVEGFDWRYYKKIYQAIRTSNPDVIRLHGSSLILPAWLIKISNKKKVKIIAVETQANHLKSKLENLWLGIALISANKVVFLTEFYRSQIKRSFSFIFSASKTTVIPNGLDLSKFKPYEKQLHDSILVGMQSRIVKIKDYDTLLLAIKQVQNERVNLKIELRIAGDGENKKHLENLAEKLGIRHMVKFTGMLDEDELINFMNSLDIYIHASFGETMSTAIMQAMACKLPIIASDVDGIKNMLQDNVTALLVPVQNPEKLTNAILKLCDDRELAQLLAGNAYNYSTNNLSNNLMFNRYKKIYIGENG